jgi:hypothetical protein
MSFALPGVSGWLPVPKDHLRWSSASPVIFRKLRDQWLITGSFSMAVISVLPEIPAVMIADCQNGATILRDKII